MDLAFCSRCGRLLADEPGELCDRCDPSLRSSITPPKPAFFTRAPATWSLIALTILVSWAVLAFSENDSLPGSAFGSAVLHGQWWLLITALFVHFNSAHLIGNIIFLWAFGKRVERILGPKTFVAFYLTCGLAGGMMRLILDPELHFSGASGAVFGLAGAPLSIYGLRFKTLSGKQWLKFLLLLLWAFFGFYDGNRNLWIDNVAHSSGFRAGILLGAIFALRSGWDRRAKSVLFTAVGVVLLGMAIWARIHNGSVGSGISGTRNSMLLETRS